MPSPKPAFLLLCFACSSTDNFTTNDAAPDAAPPDGALGDAPSGPFCQGRPVTFCEDFEDVVTIDALIAKWQGTKDGTGTLQLLPGLQSKNALQATAGSNEKAMILHAPFARMQTSIALEFDLRVDAAKLGVLDAAALTAFVFGTSYLLDPVVYFYLANGGLGLAWIEPTDAGRKVHAIGLNTQPIIGTWDGRWGFLLTLADGTIHVKHNGIEVAINTDDKLPQSVMNATQLTLGTGLPTNTIFSGTVAVTVDNLVFDLK